MKLVQDHVVYNIRKHGEFHVSDIHVCPECYSSNIGNVHEVLKALHKSTEGRGTYWCRDCGCEFDEKTTSHLTSTGRSLSRILYGAHIMFSVIAPVSFIIGVVLSVYTLMTYDKYETHTNMLLSILLLIVAPIISLIISHLFGAMYINIFEDDTQKEVS